MSLTFRNVFGISGDADFTYKQGNATKTIDLDLSLHEMLGLNGGVEAMFRHATAALLNSCTADHQGDQFDFLLSAEQVIDLVQDVIEQPISVHRAAALELGGDLALLNELEPDRWDADREYPQKATFSHSSTISTPHCCKICVENAEPLRSDDQSTGVTPRE